MHMSLWPRLEPVDFLRGQDRHLSINGFGELEGLGCDYRIVFEEPFNG